MKKTIHMLKKSAKPICKIVYIFCMFIMVTTCSFASNDVNSIISDINSGEEVYGVIGTIIGMMAWIAFGIAIFKVIQIGMLFMIGAGKARNDAKAALIPWLIGALVCVMFGTVGPWIIGLIMSVGPGGGVFDI